VIKCCGKYYGDFSKGQTAKLDSHRNQESIRVQMNESVNSVRKQKLFSMGVCANQQTGLEKITIWQA
jgi:hypothetical protein